MQHVPERGDRAIVQVGGGGPNAVQRRSLIAARIGNGLFFAIVREPTPVVSRAMLDRQCVEPHSIGSYRVDGDDAIGIAAPRSIGAMATGAMSVEDSVSGCGERSVDGKRIRRRFERFEPGVEVLKIG